MVITDICPLVQSRQFYLKPGEEVRVDLVLKKQPPNPKTMLTGVVYAGRYRPICKATVKVMNSDYDPIYHTVTDNKGIYVIKNILYPGRYKITATAEGYQTAPIINLFLSLYKAKTINLSLLSDPSADQGVVYGMVTDTWTKQPINNASIILLDAMDRPAILTTSNTHGQYMVNGIRPGKYTIKARQPGYVDSSTLILVEKSLLIKADIPMRKSLMCKGYLR